MSSSGAADLIRQIAEGDAEAFVRFYDRYAPLVYPLIRRIVPDPAEAAVCLEEIFWECRESARDYDPTRDTTDAWLVGRVRAHAIERMRNRRRRDARPLADPGSGGTPTPDGPAVLERSVLTRAFERLPDPQPLEVHPGLPQAEPHARGRGTGGPRR